MAPGVLWVSSHISPPSQVPSGVDILTSGKFCNWYENTHIQEVTALPGVPRAARYEAKEFRGLDGQSRPSEELLKGVFEQARFDTRFYEDVDVASSSDAEVDINTLKQIEGFKRVRRFKVVSGTTLDRFVRSNAVIRSGLALIEFGGEELPVERVSEVMGKNKDGEEVGWYRLKRVYNEKNK
ncbi:hypothetical protein N0V90_007017 [Kalmusia sp. IMI 367209]|nr:hypothetical protein N0V90_007017 [Kalmusia sp. IMI 367209]